jgi:hypothetical protein
LVLVSSSSRLDTEAEKSKVEELRSMVKKFKVSSSESSELRLDPPLPGT